ncbi:MAG TPA: gamma-glutamyl-gamma-aminobutyrate hydrolase family protein [Thermoleophilaceae bacterium]|jgi:putative glutamine amidotransferase
MTTSEVRNPVRDEQLPHAVAGREEMVLNFHYMRAVTAAGGLPVVMSPQPLDAVPDLIGRLDGLLIPGGPDIDPATYGDVPHEKLGPLFPEIDRFEIACLREAERIRIPVLGICRGMQIVNVAHGGTLIQDLPAEVGTEVMHRRGSLSDPPAMHAVRIEPDSRIAAVIGGTEAVVNAFHHQAPRAIGDGLRPVAWTADGVVEALEREGVLAVQWHCEAMQDSPEQRALFADFVEAARRARRG